MIKTTESTPRCEEKLHRNNEGLYQMAHHVGDMRQRPRKGR